MRLEQDMLRAQRTETIGRLAGGVAHDLNNVLSPILVTASLLEEQLPEHRDDLGLIISSAQRGSRMINRLLGFARGSESELEPLDVGALVVDVLRLLRDAIPKSIAFETELARGLYVQGDETQLHQVLTNLVVNARDAMPGGGTLTIHTRALELSRGERTSNERGPSAGKYVVIEVADTGIGIPLELQDAVFDPYFTTKEIGKGTGLGLSTSATILDRHSGFLTVESTLGQGTTFKAFLPQIEVDEVDADDARESKRRAPQQSGAVVLVVDDEPAILQSVERLLLASGYRVKTASDGIEGLAVFDASPELDLVITDVMMPGMSGDMLVQAMRKRQPNVRILAWSGRVDAGRRAALDAHIDAFLAKPFSAGELRELVEQVLRGS
jgi:CheY-like chemotaxis protein